MARFSLAQHIEEIERELEQRARVYPALVSKRKLGASIAEYQVARMEAALASLKWLQRHERVLRQRCPELFGRER